MMHLAEINEVIKASPAIQIQSKITHLQRRAWNILLANAYNELPNKDIHRVSIAELAKSLGFNSKDSEHLKETLEALVDCTVEWNLLGKDKKERWGVASLLASAEIEKGICTYGFATTPAAETLQPSYLHETESPLAKPVHESIYPDFVGSLF